jgi:hypothetical protein
MTEGTGWPNNESPESYNVHANVKLTEAQKAKIAESGESESQWIREAIEMRLEHEITEDEKRLLLKDKLHKRMGLVTGQEKKPVKENS